MKSSCHPLDLAAVLVGGRRELATALGVSPSAIGNWKARGVPVEHCAAIERLAGGRVTRRDLRPEDWARLWPELAAPTGQPCIDVAHATKET